MGSLIWICTVCLALFIRIAVWKIRPGELSLFLKEEVQLLRKGQNQKVESSQGTKQNRQTTHVQPSRRRTQMTQLNFIPSPHPGTFEIVPSTGKR